MRRARWRTARARWRTTRQRTPPRRPPRSGGPRSRATRCTPCKCVLTHVRCNRCAPARSLCRASWGQNSRHRGRNTLSPFRGTQKLEIVRGPTRRLSPRVPCVLLLACRALRGPQGCTVMTDSCNRSPPLAAGGGPDRALCDPHPRDLQRHPQGDAALLSACDSDEVQRCGEMKDRALDNTTLCTVVYGWS